MYVKITCVPSSALINAMPRRTTCTLTSAGTLPNSTQQATVTGLGPAYYSVNKENSTRYNWEFTRCIGFVYRNCTQKQSYPSNNWDSANYVHVYCQDNWWHSIKIDVSKSSFPIFYGLKKNATSSCKRQWQTVRHECSISLLKKDVAECSEKTRFLREAES